MTTPVEIEAAGPGLAAIQRLRELGRHEAARRALEAWIAERPDDLRARALLVQTLIAAGDAAAAEAALADAQARDPGAPAVHRSAARLHLQGRRLGEAVAAARAAVAAEPADPENRLVLAMALIAAGERQAARAEIEAAGPSAEAWLLRAQLAQGEGRLDEAVGAMQAALELKPHLPVWGALGRVLQMAGRGDEAREAYRRALTADPDSAAAAINLGRLLAEEGRLEEAEAVCRRAVEQRPDAAAAHFALAGVLHAAGRPEAAEAAYRKAVALDPALEPAQLGLARVLAEQMKTQEARAVAEAVHARRPTLGHFLQARLSLSIIPPSAEAIAAERAAYGAALEAALQMPGRIEDPAAGPLNSRFYLAYHGLNDRPLLERLDRLFAAKAPELDAAVPGARRRRPGGRIRVGFVSQFLGGHTIGRLYRGLIGALDRQAFEVVAGFLPHTPRDAARAEIAARADRAIELAPDLAGQRAELAAADLDVLFYPDVGMAPASYLLARARLAPVQVVGWGHPETTGLKSLDYFLSGAGFEPQGAAAHYTERLVRLGRLPAFYEPLPETADKDRAAFGLPAGRLYGCPQSLFKVHPDFDAVLAEILERDPDGWLVLVEGPTPAWSAALRARWAAADPRLAQRAVFLPRMPANDFVALLAAMDVLLDPPHFGSGNTLYEALWNGAPVVTWPGAFARGRIVAAAYRQMGAGEDLIVDRLADYAARAVAVACDGADRAALRAAARRELFADRRALAEIEAFLKAAVAEAAA